MGQKHYAAITIVGVAAAGLGGFIGIDSLLHAAGVQRGAGSTAHYTVLAVLALVIAVVGAAMAIYAEHQLHHQPGGRSAWAANEGWRTSNAGWQAGSRRRVHTPASASVLALFFTIATVICLFSTLQGHTYADRSAYTQAHGVTESAIADNVQNIAHHSKNSTTYTNQIAITVQHPSIGNGNATVYGQGTTSVQSGDTITVLVDPRQPGYAEIPGSPYYTASGWIIGLIVTIILAAITAYLFRLAIVMGLRHRRVSHGRLHAVGA
jgi:hypothetical protein